MKTRYTVMNGQVIAEKRNGVRREYVPDPLGSTVALRDNTQTITDTFDYWPYGEESSRTGTTATSLRFVGTHGCRRDNSSKTSMRARELDTRTGRWMTQDPISFNGGDWNLYRYVRTNPIRFIDPTGLFCIHFFSDCIGNTCDEHPECPSASQTGHFTCNTGLNYGCCGPFAYADDRMDFLSIACCKHDICLATLSDFLIPYNACWCDFELCKGAYSALFLGCKLARDPDLCRLVAAEIMSVYCTNLGTTLVFHWLTWCVL